MALPMLSPVFHDHLVTRDMQPSDADAVHALNARIWRAHYPGIITSEQVEYMLAKRNLETFRNQITDPNGRAFVIEESGEPVGYAMLERRGEGEWYLDKLYVDAARHRGGLGGALFAHVLKTLQPRTVSLRVNRKNVKAIQFYQKAGFSVYAQDVLDIGNGFVMDDFLMRWDA